jgi:segregation and condensation protein B
MHSPAETKRILEAALLTAQEPLGVADLKRLFDEELGAEVLKALLAEVREEWSGRAVELVQLASGWRFQTRAEFRPYVERLFPEKPPRYSRAVMETLAIIAYRQPASRPDIDAIRGVNSEAVLDNLLDRRMVRIAGRKDAPGRPYLYETTRDFLVAFGLRDLADLPKVEGDLVVPETPADAAGAAESGEGGEISPATDAAQQDPGPGGAGVTPRG